MEVRRVDHAPAAVAALIGRILRLEADPAQVRVVLEARHGLLVETLVDAGFTVLAVNPDLVARRRDQRARRTTPRTPASPGCLRWTATPGSSPWSRTAPWPPSCARSPATTSALPATRPACSTGCGPT
jgi:hypothetical protein